MLAADGAQTQVDIAVGSVSLSTLSLTATYRHYLASSILTATEYHAVPVLPLPPTREGAAQGTSLLPEGVLMQATAPQVFSAASLPDFSCSSQWSVSLILQIPASVLSATASHPLLSVLAETTATAAAAWPAVSLKVSPGNGGSTALAVQWGPSDAAVREQAVSIRPNRDGVASVHLAVVRDGSRLGVWLDSSGGWLLEDVWCLPASQAVRYCNQRTDDTAYDSSFRAIALGGGSGGGAGGSTISITSARVYNYALPALSLAAESGCVDDGSCGRFLLAGWSPPSANSIPPGSISGSGVAPVGSTPIPLRSTSFYLLVGRVVVVVVKDSSN